MKLYHKDNLYKQAKAILEGEELTEAFYRLPGHVIGNELYSLNREIDTFTKGQMNGNDFDETTFNSFIRQMQKIKKEAKKFNSKEDVPVSYQYKK